MREGSSISGEQKVEASEEKERRRGRDKVIKTRTHSPEDGGKKTPLGIPSSAEPSRKTPLGVPSSAEPSRKTPLGIPSSAEPSRNYYYYYIIEDYDYYNKGLLLS